MSDEFMGVESTTQEAATPETQGAETVETGATETPAAGEQAVTENPVETAFAKRLSQKEAQLRQEMEQNYSPYMGFLQNVAQQYGFSSVDEYLQAVEHQRMIDEGRDPEVEALKQRVNSFEREKQLTEQEKQLSEKPFYKDWEADIKSSAEAWNADYHSAYALLLTNRIGDVVSQVQQERQAFEAEKEAFKEQTIKEYLAQKKKSIGVTEGEGATPVTEVKAPKTFDEAKAASLSILKQMMGGS